MGPEGLKGRINKAIEGFRGGPKLHAEEPKQAIPMASPEQIQELFALIQEVIDLKVLNISLSSGKIELGISKTPEGKVTNIEMPPAPEKEDTVLAVGLRIFGQHVERYERRRYSDKLEVTEAVTEEEIKRLIK